MDPKLLRVYRFLVQRGRRTVDDIPEPYKTVMKGEMDGDS